MPKLKFKRTSQIVTIVAISSTAIFSYSRSSYKHWIDAELNCFMFFDIFSSIF